MRGRLVGGHLGDSKILEGVSRNLDNFQQILNTFLAAQAQSISSLVG